MRMDLRILLIAACSTAACQSDSGARQLSFELGGPRLNAHYLAALTARDLIRTLRMLALVLLALDRSEHRGCSA